MVASHSRIAFTVQDVDEKFARDSLQIWLAGTEPELVQAVLALGKDLCKFLEQGVVLCTLRRLRFEPTEKSKKWCLGELSNVTADKKITAALGLRM
ncbi:hypothetical protein V5799_004392 [Amblyomma americanum]|uniref:Uncharacterized protein n=1 Tax=Amblyomma americanum TaxID=6943 RepID=A0AAQ4D688_AMBAM